MLADIKFLYPTSVNQVFFVYYVNMSVSSVDNNVFGKISQSVTNALIVAYKEDTSELTSALVSEGLKPKTIRKQYTEKESSYSPAIRCMLTHIECWKKCLEHDGITLILEADFVPSVGFGDKYLPFDLRKQNQSFGYLYACGPQLYDIDRNGFARGHAGGLVAYAITKPTARLLVDYAGQLLGEIDATQYYPFDSGIGFYLMEKDVQSYVPWRMLGEHGGIPNNEHKQAGLGKTHRADTLVARLAFLPAYANGSRFRFWLTRSYAKAHGIGRLLFLKYLAKHDYLRAEDRRMVWKYVVSRYLTLR